MTHPHLTAFLDGLDPQELSVAAGLAAFLRAEGEGGLVPLGEWMGGVRAEMAHVAEDLGVHGVRPEEGSDAVGRLLEERVLPRLEGAGLLVRVRRDDGADALRATGDLATVLPEGRAALADEVAATIRRLEERRAAAYQGSGSVAAPENTGSRLYGTGLTKIYRRRRVVSEVDLSVSQGEIVGLLGPNGAGKTTTFYMMVGLIPPDGGTVHLDGEDLTGVPMYRRARMGIGYLAQEPSIFRKLTVEENVRAILETLKLPKSQEKERLEHLLQELGLAGLRTSKAYSLSGGERRRLEITRALVQRPKFMLLDEPFAGIDPIAVNDIQQIVRGLKARGIGVVISDHNVEQTLEIVDRAYIMYEGRIRVSGTVSELVWNDEAAEIYLGPTLTARMRGRYPKPAAV